MMEFDEFHILFIRILRNVFPVNLAMTLFDTIISIKNDLGRNKFYFEFFLTS